VKQAAASSYTAATAALGGALTRETLTVLLEEEGAECSLSGVSLASGSQHVDHHTVIDHQKPNCNSHEIYKYVLDGSSHGVFNGKVFVRQDAQKTDARQTNNCLLLSDTATIDTKPQLEIFADDVKCSHGATVGQLDDEQVFYMRARGIPLARAREILTMAFVGAVVATIHHDAVRQFVEAAVRTRLNRMRGQGETKR
jgi:Fe-S cluster assembly protein SufD